MVSKPFFWEARFSRVLGEFFLFFVGGSRRCFSFFVGCKVERCHRCQAQTGGNVSTLHDGQSFLIILGKYVLDSVHMNMCNIVGPKRGVYDVKSIVPLLHLLRREEEGDGGAHQREHETTVFDFLWFFFIARGSQVIYSF